MKRPGAANAIAVRAIRFYQMTISPFLGERCRFYPTCSEYARQCFVYYSFYKALAKSIWRLLRCQPFSSGYEDEPKPEYAFPVKQHLHQGIDPLP